MSCDTEDECYLNTHPESNIISKSSDLVSKEAGMLYKQKQNVRICKNNETNQKLKLGNFSFLKIIFSITTI